ncbi:TPA: helix-turn-helix transcriptional regulator [Serratia marcescens]
MAMIGKRLKEARLSKNLTQWQVAELIGVEGTGANTRIAHYETERYSPSFPVARQLAKVLSVPEYYFYIVDDIEAQLLLERYRTNQAKGKTTSHMLIYELEDILQLLKKRL